IQALLPADMTLSNGTGTFSATLKTAGSQTLKATDISAAAITGTGSVQISAAAVASLSLTAPAGSVAGTGVDFTVTARDSFGNTATGYAGTVHFTSSRSSAVLPADASLANGVGSFTAVLKDAGTQTLSAADSASAGLQDSASIVVQAAAATSFSLSAP